MHALHFGMPLCIEKSDEEMQLPHPANSQTLAARRRCLNEDISAAWRRHGRRDGVAARACKISMGRTDHRQSDTSQIFCRFDRRRVTGFNRDEREVHRFSEAPEAPRGGPGHHPSSTDIAKTSHATKHLLVHDPLPLAMETSGTQPSFLTPQYHE